jgi:hypothetical protein
VKIVNWGILAEPHNWVVVAFACLFWAALMTLLQPNLPGLNLAGGGKPSTANSKLQTGGNAT